MNLIFHLAQLRHAYFQLAAEGVIKQKEFAEGLIAPVIRFLEKEKIMPPTTDDEAVVAEPHGYLAAQLRADGWSVAVHNDYRLDGKPFTFWLWTHPDGRWIKGEGHTDTIALIECARAAAALTAPAGSVGPIVPPHCSSSTLAFDPGVLSVNRDGSGYIAINEDDFVLEDDRCEGPDGPEGSVHWIVRLNTSEIIALRDFLSGTPATPHADTAEGVGVPTLTNAAGEPGSHIARQAAKLLCRIEGGDFRFLITVSALSNAEMSKEEQETIRVALLLATFPTTTEANLRDMLAGCREITKQLTIQKARDDAKIHDLNEMVLRYLYRAETAEAALEKQDVRTLKFPEWSQTFAQPTPPAPDDLVERLTRNGEYLAHHCYTQGAIKQGKLDLEAAIALAQLRAENERLRANYDHDIRQQMQRADLWKGKAEAAEAENAAVREALERVTDHLDTWQRDYSMEATAETLAAIYCARQLLRGAALAPKGAGAR